ncbi:G-protein coupled receptor 4-like [Huso huso]|uniref:G-protein coupled receptor 4-like n=1 Tax=Huso huso TaxID=61971 RepID=A0ABR0Y4N1_HUSHU
MMNNSSSDSCDNIDFSSDQTFLSVLYSLVFCIGLPANCLALYGLYRLVKTDNALPVYVINLLLSDLLQISTLPLWIDYYSHGHVWRYDRTACIFVCVISNISLYSSIFFLCCISLERYLAIAHPLWFRNLHPHKLAAVTCVVFVHRRTRMSLADSLSVSAEEKERISRLLALVLIIFILVFGPHHLIVFVKCIGLIVLVENSIPSGFFGATQLDASVLRPRRRSRAKQPDCNVDFPPVHVLQEEIACAQVPRRPRN